MSELSRPAVGFVKPPVQWLPAAVSLGVRGPRRVTPDLVKRLRVR